MDFNLTNGTISSLTITTDKNIDSATVTGADYTINENTITLTNLTASLVLELTGESSSGINKIHLGTLNTKNFYFGTLGVKKIYLGQYLVYAKGEPTEEGYFKLSDGKWLYTKDGQAFESIEETGHTVTINFTNGLSTSYWKGTEIYDNYTIVDRTIHLSSADQIGFMWSADGSITITTNTGKIFIYGKSNDLTESTGNITISSSTAHGITTEGKAWGSGKTGILSDNYGTFYLDDAQKQFYSSLLYIFNVTANGTITIDQADWRD